MSAIITTTTRAAVVNGFGAPDVLEVQEIQRGGPRGGEVQILVGAAAVNPIDLQTRRGSAIPAEDARFPMVLGWDVAGTVAALGEDVGGFAVGDRVAAMTFQPSDQNGTYAERLNLAAGLLAPIPDGLSLEQAATLPLAGLTASQLLARVAQPAGASLLVNAPTGAVGRLVVQLAVSTGLRVIGVARPERRDDVLALGAEHVVERGDFHAAVRDLNPDGVDAAIDMVGGDVAWTTFRSVRDGGAYATVVLPYNDDTGPFGSERGVRVAQVTVEPNTPELTRLLHLAADGVLTTVIEQTFPLTDVAEAHRRQAAGGLTGKLVLVP